MAWLKYISIDAMGELVDLAQKSNCCADSLAKHLGTSRGNLERSFQKMFGVSPQVWLNERRLEMAARELRSDRLIKTVALDLGFKSVAHFAFRFRLYHGVSPKMYLASGQLQTKPSVSRNARTPRARTAEFRRNNITLVQTGRL
jgi:AraC-like DNA-binding protein